MALNVHCVIDGYRFAVKMSRTFILAIDNGGRSPECVYQGVGVYVAGEQPHSEECLVDGIAGMYYCNIKQSVGYACRGSDVGVVAVLGCVAHSYQKRLFGKHMPVGAHGVYLGMEFYVFFYCASDVSEFSPAVLPGEVAAHSRVEAHSEGAEERIIVDRSVIALDYVVIFDDFDCG